jgi:hypothetical protein
MYFTPLSAAENDKIATVAAMTVIPDTAPKAIWSLALMPNFVRNRLMNVAVAARAGALASRLVVMEFIWHAKTLDIFKCDSTDE